MRITANENESSFKAFAQKHSNQTNSIFYLSNNIMCFTKYFKVIIVEKIQKKLEQNTNSKQI